MAIYVSFLCHYTVCMQTSLQYLNSVWTLIFKIKKSVKFFFPIMTDLIKYQFESCILLYNEFAWALVANSDFYFLFVFYNQMAVLSLNVTL